MQCKTNKCTLFHNRNNYIYFELETPASALAFGSQPAVEVTSAGINNISKQNGHAALHLPLNSTHLNPTELACRDIKIRTVSKNLKEMQML
jgi:hypothetical protein